MPTRASDGGRNDDDDVGDGIDRPTTSTSPPDAKSDSRKPRPPRPVAPGDVAPGVGRVVGVRKAYDRYLCVEQVDVESGVVGGGGERGRARGEKTEVVSYDVVSHPRSQRAFVVVFPFHPPKECGEGGRRSGDGSDGGGDEDDGVATVTLLREYCHGVNSWLYTLPTGGYDPDKHGEVEAGGIRRAAESELSEEAMLEGGTWECLLPDEGGGATTSTPNPLESGIPEAKWCANRFWPFLCLDPRAAEAPLRRDEEEEGRMEVKRVTTRELRAIVSRGQMLLPSVQASWMAIERLREMGYAVD